MARTKSPDSVRSRLIKYVKRAGSTPTTKKRGRWVTLENIYAHFDAAAENIGLRAGIRGILNRECVEKKGAFQRNAKVRGQYRVNTKVA